MQQQQQQQQQQQRNLQQQPDIRRILVVPGAGFGYPWILVARIMDVSQHAFDWLGQSKENLSPTWERSQSTDLSRQIVASVD